MTRIAPIPETPIPPRTPRGSPLGLLFENALVRFIVDVFNRVKSAMGETLRYAIERTLETLEPAAIDILRPVITKAFESPDLPPEVRALGTQLLSGEHQIELAMLIPVGIGLVVGVVSGAFRPFSMVAQYYMDRQIESARLDPGTAIRAIWRDPTLFNLARGDLRDMGWSDERVAAIITVAEERLGLGELLILWRRGNLSEQDLVQRAAELGFRSDKVQDFKAATELIPGPADLVRFALREAWRDDIAERWGYDQGLVPEFGEWMRKQGLSSDWAKRYWRSHWVVPTWGQGLEMWWRAEISESELIDLLKVNDIAPGWIPHLMAIARPVPGRIDRRWAFQEGEITESELYQLYRMDGYDDRWATILANTVVKRAVSEAKGLTRAAIEKAYRKRRLSQAEAIGMLDDIGIQETIARFYLSQADSDRADDLLDRRIDVVGRRYLDGDLLESQVREDLVTLGVSGEEIDVYLEEWNIAKAAKTRRPTRSNLDEFFREGIIGIDQYRDQMDRLGFSALYVDWYLGALAIERQQILEKEEKAAWAEQERIEKDRRKTDYQIAKARLDVQIAELQAAIASTQVALVDAENERERKLLLALPAAEIATLERDYQPLLFETDAVISEAQLQIARLQTVIKDKQEMISLVDQSLITNIDMTVYTGLRAARLRAQTEQARLGELIAAAKVAIAQLREVIVAFEEPEPDTDIGLQILALRTEISRLQATIREQRESISLVNRSLAANVDMTVFAELRATRLQVQTEQARLGELIAAAKVAIAELKEAIITFEEPEDVSRAKGQILALQTDMARNQEVQAQLLTEIRTIDVELTATLAPVRRQELIVERAEFVTDITSLESQIAAVRVSIAVLRETPPTPVEPRPTRDIELQILALQTDMARNQEAQAQLLTEIKEIDEEMSQQLAPVRRQELLEEKATLATDITRIEVEIAALREGIREARSVKERLEQELETRITALPGREAQIAIREEYQILIANFQGFIRTMRESVAQLRMAKAQILVGYIGAE